MSKPETKKRRKQCAKEEFAIRQIINDWKPIGFPTPNDEYDCLVHHLLSVLNSNGNQQDVSEKMKDELKNHFGLRSFPEKEIYAIADKIWACWKKIKMNK